MAESEVGEGKIEGSRWRESHQMMTSGLISTVRNEHMFIKETRPCRAMIIRVKVADGYLRRPRSADSGRTPNHRPNRRNDQPRSAYGMPSWQGSPSTPSCF